MQLILVRHGETDWNQEKRVQGLSDVELNDEGKRQAEGLALALKGLKIEAIYSSPLRRALETAQAIAAFHHLTPQIEADLRELDTGELDGLTFVEMRRRYGDFLNEWVRDAGSVTLPGGESLRELQERAWDCTQRLLKRHPQGSVVAVSHNFVILSLICKAIELDLSRLRQLRLDVAAISIIDFGERGPSLVLFNDTCHLKRGSVSYGATAP